MAEQDQIEVNDHQTFAARRLQVTDIPGAVQVRVGDTATMRVCVTGPRKLVERIQREVRADVLHISGPRGAGGTTVISHGRGGTQTVIARGRGGVAVAGINFGTIYTVSDDMVMVGGRVISGVEDVTVIEGDGGVRVVVEVPLHTPITIDEGLFGTYDIGDTEGPLDLRIGGSADATVGRVAATRVVLSGSGRVEVAAINGRELDAKISGCGNITVREGRVDTLTAKVSGQGDVTFGGIARHADLKISGMGNIRIKEVTESVNDRVSGMGRIDVHVPPRRDPGSFWS